MIKSTSSDDSACAQCPSLLNKLPLELRLNIYKLVLSADPEDSEDANNNSIMLNVAQHKARRDPVRGNRHNVFKIRDIGNDYFALMITCAKVHQEVMQHITLKIVWRLESTDILSCFLGTNRLVYFPTTITESRIQLLSNSTRVEVVIPEWDLWDQAPVELTRLGVQLHVPLTLKFIDQIYKGVESRGLVAAEDCWSQFAKINDVSGAGAEGH
jgi:hypothetical protein